MNDWRRFEYDANLIRDLEECGAVHLDRPRTIGFERRPTRRASPPRQVSPGGGMHPDRWYWDDDE